MLRDARPIDVLGLLLCICAAWLASLPIQNFLREPYSAAISVALAFPIGYFGAAVWFRLVR